MALVVMDASWQRRSHADTHVLELGGILATPSRQKNNCNSPEVGTTESGDHQLQILLLQGSRCLYKAARQD